VKGVKWIANAQIHVVGSTDEVACAWHNISTNTGRLMIAVPDGLAEVERDLITRQTAPRGAASTAFAHRSATARGSPGARGTEVTRPPATPLPSIPCRRGR
jgi:hypothetical protein